MVKHTVRHLRGHLSAEAQWKIDSTGIYNVKNTQSSFMILSFVLKLFQDQGSSSVDDQEQKAAESILRFFPVFRAFALPPPSFDVEVVSNLNRNKSRTHPCFLSKLKQFKQLLRGTLIPKHSFNDGEIVTGEGRANVM